MLEGSSWDPAIVSPPSLPQPGWLHLLVSDRFLIFGDKEQALEE